MQIHIIRHGETEANKTHQLQGHKDTPLTETGEQEVSEVADSLADYDYDIIFSSPLKRALDTSKLLAQRLGTDIRITPELKEICYGGWEGYSKDELRQLDIWEQREQNKYNFTHPGEFNGVEGQSYADILPRVTDLFEQLIQSDHQLVLLVTHLGVLRNAKKHFEGCSDDEAVRFTPENSQVYAVTISDRDTETTILNLN